MQKLPIVKRLETELAELRRELDIELPRIIETAREHGDLKENAEYHAAKERQGMVRARAGTIEERLRQLAVYDMSSIPTDVIGYRSRVKPEDQDTGDVVVSEIVFPEEIEAKGCVSISSPLGQALLNRSEGDEVKVQTPKGVRMLEVLEVTTIHERSAD